MSGRLIILGVVAAGLPLSVWWLTQQRIRYPWNGRPSENPRRGWMSRHELSSDEAHDVADAVLNGERLPDGRLRAAAADWAEVLLRPGRPRSPRTRRLLIGLLIAWVAAISVLVVRSVVIGQADEVPWSLPLIWLGLTASLAGRRRRVRRALALNTGPPSHSDDSV